MTEPRLLTAVLGAVLPLAVLVILMSVAAVCIKFCKRRNAVHLPTGNSRTRLGQDNVVALSDLDNDGQESIPVSQLNQFIKKNMEQLRKQQTNLLMLFQSEQQSQARAATEVSTSNSVTFQGYRMENRYIAGTKELSAIQFWQTVWESRPRAVVLGLSAEETNKLMRVTPEDSKSWDMDVSIQLVENRGEWSLWEIKLEKIKVKLFLMPRPEDLSPHSDWLLMFFQEIREQTHDLKGPTLLIFSDVTKSCSGMFIALDFLLDQAESENAVNIHHCVRQMCERKEDIILLQEHFVTLYVLLQVALEMQSFRCKPKDITSKLSRNLLHRNDSIKDIIGKEFKYLNTRLQLSTPYESSASGLTMKSLLTHTYLNDDYTKACITCKMASCICQSKGVEEEGYETSVATSDVHVYDVIGEWSSRVDVLCLEYPVAVYANGYHEKNEFIAVPTPKQQDAELFWKLLLSQSCSIVIHLDDVEEPYFPCNPNEISAFGDIKVVVISVERTASYSVTQLSIEDSTDCTVWIFEWLADKAKKLYIDNWIDLVEKVESTKKKECCFHVIVSCRDGLEWSGFFIAAYNIIQRMKEREEVDVYNAVLQLRLRQPNFIQTKDQYRLLYKLLKEYITHSYDGPMEVIASHTAA